MARSREGGYIDISVAIRDGMPHWPDNPPIVVERVLDLAHGDVATVSKISLGVHTATHMDAPSHFLAGQPGIDQMPFDATIGPARVIRIRDPQLVRVRELEKHDIERGERILLRTQNSPRVWQSDAFVEDFVHLSVEAAQWLGERGVRTLGVDYLSVGGFLDDSGEAVHHALLAAGIWIIEGLDLSRVPPGPCELICLPLKLLDGDGAPCRAIVRRLGATPARPKKAGVRARAQPSRARRPAARGARNPRWGPARP
jgi:arylformamidase